MLNNRLLRLGASLVLCWLLASCANVNRFEPPQINLVALKLLPREGFDQPVLLSLRVVNPNKSALPIQGLRYRLSLNGHNLISGFRDQLPLMMGRGDTYLELEARINLVSAAFELAQLLSEDTSRLVYRFEADLDLNGLWPDAHVVSKGEVPLKRY